MHMILSSLTITFVATGVVSSGDCSLESRLHESMPMALQIHKCPDFESMQGELTVD